MAHCRPSTVVIAQDSSSFNVNTVELNCDGILYEERAHQLSVRSAALFNGENKVGVVQDSHAEFTFVPEISGVTAPWSWSMELQDGKLQYFETGNDGNSEFSIQGSLYKQ